jgi:hypothetical protein
MSETIDEIIAGLQKLARAKETRDEVIQSLQEVLAVGRKPQFGNIQETAKLIFEILQEQGANWDTQDYWAQFRVFPAERKNGSPIYFGHKLDSDEFVWGIAAWFDS